jgi:hypothetical protein
MLDQVGPPRPPGIPSGLSTQASRPACRHHRQIRTCRRNEFTAPQKKCQQLARPANRENCVLDLMWLQWTLAGNPHVTLTMTHHGSPGDSGCIYLIYIEEDAARYHNQLH